MHFKNLAPFLLFLSFLAHHSHALAIPLKKLSGRAIALDVAGPSPHYPDDNGAGQTTAATATVAARDDAAEAQLADRSVELYQRRGGRGEIVVDGRAANLLIWKAAKRSMHSRFVLFLCIV